MKYLTCQMFAYLCIFLFRDLRHDHAKRLLCCTFSLFCISLILSEVVPDGSQAGGGLEPNVCGQSWRRGKKQKKLRRKKTQVQRQESC